VLFDALKRLRAGASLMRMAHRSKAVYENGPQFFSPRARASAMAASIFGMNI